MIPFAAALIAGGKSSRMGRDKRCVEIAGAPLWSRQLDLLDSLRPAELFFAGPPGPWETRARVIADVAPGAGPLAGLCAVLETTRCARLLVLPIDVPFMPRDFLERLLDQPGSVIPLLGGRFEPLVAVYSREAAAEAREALAGGNYSLQDFCCRLGAQHLEVAPQEAPFFSNLNTPEQLAQARIVRVGVGGLERRDDVLAVEEPLEIQVGYARGGWRVHKSVSVTMRTPGDDADLAVGFLFTEGILHDPGGQIENVACIAENVLRAELRDTVKIDLARLERHFYASSSCGVCGKASIQALGLGRNVDPLADGPVFSAALIHRLPALLRETQDVFERTGGLHAAGLFNAAGELLCRREDVGRHNAVDKVIGAMVRDQKHNEFAGALLMVSGRASFELMQKTLAAGIPALAAVGAPSSLAVELAQTHGATLLGFVRDERFNIYSAPERIRFDAAPSAV